MSLDLLPAFIQEHYEAHEWKHACAILKQDFPDEWEEIVAVLSDFRLLKSWITVGGGRKSKVAEALDGGLGKYGWKEKGFDTKMVVDGQSLNSPTHKVDCFKTGLPWKSNGITRILFSIAISIISVFFLICALSASALLLPAATNCRIFSMNLGVVPPTDLQPRT